MESKLPLIQYTAEDREMYKRVLDRLHNNYVQLLRDPSVHGKGKINSIKL